MLDVVVIGDVNLDLVLGDILGAPSPGQSVEARAYALTLGGSAANCACALARLGLAACFLGKVGDDSFGRFALDELATSGVSIDAVTVGAGEQTGVTVAISGEDRSFVSFRGTVATFTRDEIGQVPRSHVLHLAGFHAARALRPSVASLLAEARAQGATTSLDVDWDPDGDWSGIMDVLEHADILFANEPELSALTGEPQAIRAASLIGEVVPVVIAKLGSRGALAVSRGSPPIRVLAFPAQPIDTTGAGDCFSAAFLVAHLDGQPIPRALRYACAAGALATERLGSGANSPTESEIHARLATSREEPSGA